MRNTFPVLAALIAWPAAAQDVSVMRLLPGWETEEGTRIIGVEVLLNPGWKTYWRAPGPGGIPPHFDWSGSENVAETEVMWPRPEIQHAFGLTNLGYKNQVVFPIEITPANPGAPVELTLALSYGVCEDVCIPARSTDTLGADQSPYSSATRAIETSLALQPMEAAASGLTSLVCTLNETTEPPRLTAEFTFNAPPPQDIYPVFETGSEITFVRPQDITSSETGFTIVANIDHFGKSERELDLETLRITLLNETTAIDIRGCTAI